jgi:hypothetical protein
MHIADDEVSFVTFDAATAGVAELAAQRAGPDPLRVVKADVSNPDLPNQPPHQREDKP